jgi:hypothetical protein
METTSVSKLHTENVVSLETGSTGQPNIIIFRYSVTGSGLSNNNGAVRPSAPVSAYPHCSGSTSVAGQFSIFSLKDINSNS